MDGSKHFSSQLKIWLGSKKPKTLSDLNEVFYEKSFAVSFVLLMFTPALPLPTGGITHLFEIAAILLSIEMILGRRKLWLPKRWEKIDVSTIGERKTTNAFIKKLKWVESHSKPRLRHVIKSGLFLRITGFILCMLCLAAFLAPPFTGLDTLPSVGVVLIALSLILEDIILYVTGIVVGAIGISTVFVLGTVIFRSFKLWV